MHESTSSTRFKNLPKSLKRSKPSWQPGQLATATLQNLVMKWSSPTTVESTRWKWRWNTPFAATTRWASWSTLLNQLGNATEEIAAVQIRVSGKLSNGWAFAQTDGN